MSTTTSSDMVCGMGGDKFGGIFGGGGSAHLMFHYSMPKLIYYTNY